MPDVVAAIDAAADTLTECDRLPFLQALLRRARDEIVALRQANPLEDRVVMRAMAVACAAARAEALEEAAQVCEGSGAIVAEARICAAAIRALKDKPG